MIQQCPKGRLLDICLSHFLKVIQGQKNKKEKNENENENLISDNFKENKIEEIENDDDTVNKNNHVVNTNYNEKDEKDVYDKMENTHRKISALDAISDLFLSENENESIEDILSTSTSSTHVHTASCNHGNHNDTPAVR